MRRFYILFILCFIAVVPLASAKSSGRIIKVLPEFLDKKDRNTVAPSLFERDAYQANLRKNVKLRGGLGFFVNWKAKKSENLRIRIEMRGVYGNTVQNHTVEEPVSKKGWFSNWSTIKFAGERYSTFGELTAWRVTLWDGGELLSESKSFLW